MTPSVTSSRCRWAVAALCAALGMTGCGTGATADAPPTTQLAVSVPASSVTATSMPESAELDPDEILGHTREGVVRVRNTGCGELSTGTAWLAPDGRLISNRHVVEAARELDVLTWEGRDAVATGALVSSSVDIGVLDGEWSSVEGLRPLEVRLERVVPGERITIVGYPEGDRLDVSSGVAVGYDVEPEAGPGELLRATNVVKPGNSGGPVVDREGRVVGVVFAEYLSRDEALIVPWDVVAALPPGDLVPDAGCT